MDDVSELRTALLRLRGGSEWRRIAEIAGCHYITVSKLARGLMTNPTLDLFTRVRDAIKTVEQAQ